MHKNLFKNQIKLLIEGVNLKRLLKNIIKNDIEIYNLNFISHKKLEINIKANKLNKIKPLLKDYRFQTLNYYGVSFVKKYSILHFGLIIGFILFGFILFFNSNYLSNIVINGTNRIENTEIIAFLKEKNIKANTFFTSFNIDELELELESKFKDISLVSVIKKGTNVIINIKEKLYADEILSSQDLISAVDGQIIKIELKQGTLKVKVGDSVKAGDVLIEGKIDNNGEKVNCKAIGTITMKVWYKESFVFENETIENVRTGNKIENVYYKIFNKTFKIKEQQNVFENYDMQIKERYLFEYNILPIKIYKEIFYEIKENVKKNDFSLQKDAIIEMVTNNALKKVPVNIEVIDKIINISETETGKIVTCYVETLQSFN